MKLKKILSEQIKKSDMDRIGKDVNKATKLIHVASKIVWHIR